MLEVVTRDIMMEDYNISRLATFYRNISVALIDQNLKYLVVSVAW